MFSPVVDHWLDPNTARAQRELVEKQIAHPEDIPPFKAFMWAMELIFSTGPDRLLYATLLDVGCGVGHYAHLCRKLYPDIRYTGTDLSLAMIEEARRFYGWDYTHSHPQFELCHFEGNHFSEYDIVLVGQVMEFTLDPAASLELLLTTFKHTLILHRLLWDVAGDVWITLPSYGGVSLRNYRWGRSQLEARLANFDTDWLAWDGMLTIVVRRKT